MIGVLLALLMAYMKGMSDVTNGPARAATLEDVWLPIVDLAAITEREWRAARDTASDRRPAPVLDSLARQWFTATNAVHPYLVIGASPLADGDLVIQLHPAQLRETTPAALGALIQDLAITWRAVLATAGTLWPAVPGFEPGIVVVRPVRTPQGEVPELIAESRDGRTSVTRALTSSRDTMHARH
ncbi:MAG: hypothetical protein H3C62_00400 [Gemmatimonadaceae bacterium]|nr:hypothetical protein [Gemmatimonadaceae bacterium]